MESAFKTSCSDSREIQIRILSKVAQPLDCPHSELLIIVYVPFFINALRQHFGVNSAECDRYCRHMDYWSWPFYFCFFFITQDRSYSKYKGYLWIGCEKVDRLKEKMRHSRLALPFSFPLIIDCNLLFRLNIYFIEYRKLFSESTYPTSPKSPGCNLLGASKRALPFSNLLLSDAISSG